MLGGGSSRPRHHLWGQWWPAALPAWKQREKKLCGLVGRAEGSTWSAASEVAAAGTSRHYWDQLGTGNVVTAMNPSLTVGFIGGQRHCRAGDSFWSREGRGRDEQDTLRACTCRRKRWEKDLGDVPLKSGRLSRGEPAYPLCTGELRKSRATLAAGGGVSRTCRMALSCGKRWQEVGMQPCPHATTRDAWGYPWDPPPARGGVGCCWGRSPTPWAPWPTGRQREVSMGRRGAGDTQTPSPRRRGHFYHVLFAKFCPDRANPAVQHC